MSLAALPRVSRICEFSRNAKLMRQFSCNYFASSCRGFQLVGITALKYFKHQIQARSYSMANVFNLNEDILKRRFSKPFQQVETPESQLDLLDDGHMMKFIMQKEQARLDADKRSLYFRIRNSDSPDWESPRGVDLLVLYPGSWIKVYYKNNHDAENLSVFGGVLVSIHENYQNGRFAVLGAVGGIAVRMQFMIYSPLIEKIEIYFRSLPTRTMDYLWDGPISNLKGPVNSVDTETATVTKPAHSIPMISKRKTTKGPEVISKATAQLTIEERIAELLPMGVPKGFDKFRDMDEVERYREDLFSEEESV